MQPLSKLFTCSSTAQKFAKATKPFIAHLKENISSRFSSSNDVISAMGIFDPRKAPKADSQTPDLSKYGEEAIGTLLAHYGSEKPAETLHGIQQTGKPS